ncbi:MAG TPA: alkaline phosphatase [Thermoanaerobaculia bacterium]|nr:alkaline phosphatase [Thermoanaerobaculia bacterium]
MSRLIAAVTLFVCAASLAAQTPKNIILFISDGAGPGHYTSMKVRRAAEFNVGRMPVVGLATTNCADRYVTDSAAGASALATGVKVNSEAVSQLPDGQAPQTLFELAESRGKATGLVTTGAFFDATPAAFAAHAKHRGEHAPIIAQMIRSGAEVIAGAGLKVVTEKHAELPENAKAQGFTFVTSRAELDAAANASRILAVFPEQTRDLDFPDAPLPVLTKFALDRLRREAKGFFLMVEHEGIDSSSHQNNIADLNAALASFDTAIGLALDFAAQSKDTLVIVTSDHETGGMRVTETKSGRFRVEWSTTDHTAVSVPVFAFGPGSAGFAGFYDNTDVGKRLLGLFGR